MNKMTSLYQKPVSKGTCMPKRKIKINESEVKRIMGKYYQAFLKSKEQMNDIVG